MQAEAQNELARLRAELTAALALGGGNGRVDVASVVMGPSRSGGTPVAMLDCMSCCDPGHPALQNRVTFNAPLLLLPFGVCRRQQARDSQR